MTDKELLELAARAAGLGLEWNGLPDAWQPMYYEGKTYHSWDPLNDDGAALRLAVDLGLFIEPFTDGVFSQEEMGMVTVRAFLNDSLESVDIDEPIEAGDAYAATRRAIVRAAAEVGRTQ